MHLGESVLDERVRCDEPCSAGTYYTYGLVDVGVHRVEFCKRGIAVVGMHIVYKVGVQGEEDLARLRGTSFQQRRAINPMVKR